MKGIFKKSQVIKLGNLEDPKKLNPKISDNLKIRQV